MDLTRLVPQTKHYLISASILTGWATLNIIESPWNVSPNGVSLTEATLIGTGYLTYRFRKFTYQLRQADDLPIIDALYDTALDQKKAGLLSEESRDEVRKVNDYVKKPCASRKEYLNGQRGIAELTKALDSIEILRHDFTCQEIADQNKNPYSLISSKSSIFDEIPRNINLHHES